MQFEFTTPQSEFEKLIGGSYCINAFGRIEAHDDITFSKFLKSVSPPPRTPVHIDSAGGNVDAAISIGRMIRERWFSTSIGLTLLDHENPAEFIVPRKYPKGQCLSAATLIFIGGKLRYYRDGSIFGVHQFSFKNPSPNDLSRSQSLSARIARYVIEMGISPEFLELSSSVAGQEILNVPEDKLRELRIITGGETNASWSVIAKNGHIYVRGERDSIYGHQKVMLGYAKGAGFYFWAVIEAQGRETELTGFSLVEIIIDRESISIDISKRCERFLIGRYVHVFVTIDDREAHTIAYSESFGVRIRFSQDAPTFFGIYGMSTEGGKQELETIYVTLSGDHKVQQM